MEGLEFTLYQRIDGVPTMRDSDITELYQRTEAAGLTRLMFNDGSLQNASEFTDYVTRSAVIFFKITLAGNPFGYFWLNRIESTHAYCHFCAFPKYWGDGRTVQVGIEAMKICLKEFDMVMGMLPSSNEIAINYLLKVGLHKLGRVPNLIWSESDQKSVEGTMLYITKEDLQEA